MPITMRVSSMLLINLRILDAMRTLNGNPIAMLVSFQSSLRAE